MKYLLTISLSFFLSASLFAQTSRMDRSVTSRNHSVENEGATVLPLLQKAERQFRALDYEGTFMTLENAVAQNPNSAEALLLRAKFKRMVGMDSEAAIDVNMAYRINPLAANLYGYNGHGGLLNVLSIEPEKSVLGLNSFQKLSYYYDALDEGKMEEVKNEIAVEQFEKVIELIELGQLNEALESIDETLELFPRSAIAYDLKGVILKKKGQLELALDAFSRAVELAPEFAIAWYNLAQVQNVRGNVDQARLYLDRAISLQENLTKAYFARAVILKQMGEKEKALEDYNTIIEIVGDKYMEVYLNRGLTKKMLGDYGGAMADLNQAIDEFPRNAELRKNRGNLNLLFALPRKAINDYAKAIELNDEYAEAYYNRAMAFFLIYDKVSGCYDLEKSIDLGYEKAADAQQYFCTQ